MKGQVSSHKSPTLIEPEVLWSPNFNLAQKREGTTSRTGEESEKPSNSSTFRGSTGTRGGSVAWRGDGELLRLPH